MESKSTDRWELAATALLDRSPEALRALASDRQSADAARALLELEDYAEALAHSIASENKARGSSPLLRWAGGFALALGAVIVVLVSAPPTSVEQAPHDVEAPIFASDFDNGVELPEEISRISFESQS